MGDPVTRFVIRMTTASGEFYWTGYVHDLHSFGWHVNVATAKYYQHQSTAEQRRRELMISFGAIFPIERMEVVTP